MPTLMTKCRLKYCHEAAVTLYCVLWHDYSITVSCIPCGIVHLSITFLKKTLLRLKYFLFMILNNHVYIFINRHLTLVF